MKKIIPPVFVIAAFLVYINSNEKFVREYFFEMGTIVQVTLPKNKSKLVASVSTYMKTMTEIIKTDCAKISGSSDFVEINKETYHLLKQGEYYQDLNNRFSISVHTVSTLYGFPEGPYKIPDGHELSQAIEMMQNNHVEYYESGGKYYARGNGLQVDMGAFAKGWIVDGAAQFLLDHNVNDFIINAGGDIYAHGTKNKTDWSIGIKNPDEDKAYIDRVLLNDRALATSGNYERFFVEDGVYINHIFDAETGETVNTYKSVSVIAATAEKADAFATIAYLSPLEDMPELCRKNNISIILLTADDEVKKYCI